MQKFGGGMHEKSCDGAFKVCDFLFQMNNNFGN